MNLQCIILSEALHKIVHTKWLYFGFAGGSVIKKKIHLPVQETWIQSLGWEDPLEKEMATHLSTLAWSTEEPGRLQPMGSQKSRTQLSD